MLRHTAATNWVRAGVDLDVVQALLGHVSLASTTVYLHARDEDKRRAVEAVAAGKAVPVSGRALRAVPDAAVRGEPHDAQGWAGWLRARLDPAWRAGEWDGEALAVHRRPGQRADRGVAVPHPGMPDGDAPPVRALRWLPPRPGGLGPVLGRFRRRAAAAGHPPAASGDAARCPAVKATCTARACASGMSAPGARTGPSRLRRSSRGPARWPGPRNAGSPGCDRESVARRGLCRFHDQRLHRRGMLAGDELAAWVASERPRLGVHQFSLAGLPELAAHRAALRAAAP